ncbi:MAG: RHS repeat-associated core domain-containing protein [Thermoguttaceae bacterium]|nr:RHS repeat-associated core domain-containing protein [Thermoguttaceae bacterium]
MANAVGVVNHRSYNTFGVLTNEVGVSTDGNETASAVDCLFGYTGKMFDDVTELQNNVNRWYNPELGKWLSEDPIGFNAGDTNVYRYVGNNVLNGTDKLGLKVRENSSLKGGSEYDEHLECVVIWLNLENDTEHVCDIDRVRKNIKEVFGDSGIHVILWPTSLSQEEADAQRKCKTQGTRIFYGYYRQEGNLRFWAQSMNGDFVLKYGLINDAASQGQTTKAPIPDIACANLIIHEVFWHGILDRVDKTGTPALGESDWGYTDGGHGTGTYELRPIPSGDIQDIKECLKK